MAFTRRATLTAVLAAAVLMGPTASMARSSAAQLTADGRRALSKLYATEPKSRLFADNARAVLVFPTIIKGALVFGGQTGGFAIGSAPNIVVVDHGAAVSASTTTLTQDVYVFTFAQKGLMAGIDIHGSKITRIHPQ